MITAVEGAYSLAFAALQGIVERDDLGCKLQRNRIRASAVYDECTALVALLLLVHEGGGGGPRDAGIDAILTSRIESRRIGK
jgi:hypothetical protein